jgi:hypothetical protein
VLLIKFNAAVRPNDSINFNFILLLYLGGRGVYSGALTGAIPDCRHDEHLDVLLWEERCEANARLYREEPHRVLFVLGQTQKHRYQVGLEILQLHDLSQLAEFGGGGAAHHRRVILTQRAEVGSEVGLHLGGDTGVADLEALQ